jgi:hypothetical protein
MQDHRHPRQRGDRGYALILTALLLVPLMAAASVAVDLGSRYAEAAKIQRAADAAALAGVAVLPRGLTAATTEARQVAARNGYAHGVDGITVDVAQVNAEEIQVRITDPSVPEYFGGLFNGDSQIARNATSRYVRAVSLGSPRNFIGTGDLLGSGSGGDMQQIVGRTTSQTAGLRENYWLAISGQCSSRENGDRFNTVSQANYENISNPRGLSESAFWDDCDPGGGVQANAEFRDYGYIYAVTAPPGYDLGTMRIQAYDPAICNSSRPGDSRFASTGGMTTTFTVRTGSTDPLGGTPVSTPSQPRTFNRAGSGCNAWTDIAVVVPPAQGATYFIQVQAGRNTSDGTMSNGFALRASVDSKNAGGRFWGCSSDLVESSFSDPKCPQVFAVQDMGVFASLNGTRAEFFLAEVGSEYNGKQLEITLFDPGEGADALRVKAPDGTYATFDWRVSCPPGVTAPFGGCAGTGASVLDLIGDTRGSAQGCNPPDIDTSTPRDGVRDRCVYNPQPGGRRISRSKYNERSLTLTIDLPDDIATAYGGATWWKIEYTLNSAPTDRTTWSVEVKGDPVRLIPNP